MNDVVSFHQTKGGQGTTTLAAATASLAAQSGVRVLFVDMCGDACAVLGVSQYQDAVPLEVVQNLWLTPVPFDEIRHPSFDLVIVDAGRNDKVNVDGRRVLVVRPEYVALRNAVASSSTFTDLIVVTEPGRALTVADSERALGMTSALTVEASPVVARCVDAGLLAARVPESLAGLSKFVDERTFA